MSGACDQILSVAQMRAAEAALIDAGTTVEALMDTAGRGAANFVWRIAAMGRVTVLCGPGNNGGDGYVIAEALRARGGRVAVIPALAPMTAAARRAAMLYKGEVLADDADRHGEVLVDCLFGSGLTRPLGEAHAALLRRLAKGHRRLVALDLPSGVESDSGTSLNEGLPQFDLTIALGAWKYAHYLMPAAAGLGALRLVDIGVAPVAGAATVVRRPRLAAPSADSHKYRRGLLAVVGGAMPGAALLACTAARRAGAGYVKLLRDAVPMGVPPDLVVETGDLGRNLADRRISAALVGPGLGRDGPARARLQAALALGVPLLIDADALALLTPALLAARRAPTIVTPHDGELAALERAWGLGASGSKVERVTALAGASGLVVLAKGPDNVLAAPDGRCTLAPRASSWLSTAGTGDVLAGTIASRLASGCEAFAAAGEGLWLGGEAARLAPKPFCAGDLAEYVGEAFAACL
ncbi:MAG: NAD(P)H-hydrate epimerase [Sphingomonadales bacterium]|nr:NAD(P)H-hydrate epimerase [Sphingomonadales bacterium]